MGGGIAMVLANAGLPVLLKKRPGRARSRTSHHPVELREFPSSAVVSLTGCLRSA